jgi:hypothetical protein
MGGFLQSYSFVLKHKPGKSNKVVDALSLRVMLLNTMYVKVINLDNMKEFYAKDTDCIEAWEMSKKKWGMNRILYLDFHIQERFLFKNRKLYIP